MIEVTPQLLQGMGRMDQALCLLQIATLRSKDGVASTGAVRLIADELALPPSSNLSYDLSRLSKAGHVVKRGADWRITPVGRAYLDSGFTIPAFALGGAVPEGASIQGITHHPVPPTMAPIQAASGVRRLLEKTAWDSNIMLITRFPLEGETALIDVISASRGAAASHGMNLLVASDTRADDRLGLNVVSHMWASKYGIALFEDRVGRGINSNVLVEVGAMIMTGRRVLIVRDTESPDIPSDITDHIYGRVDFGSPDEVAQLLHRWLRDDLGLGECINCRKAAA